ncbi:hypothetical protein D7Z54_14495 [Salibacterium salarium]|uniref:Uncharacterized protein n=1 Tax=Salibacterium salarium TaxID=284579 RepID=A0A428N2X1_9BACI|nr:hypothetical protein [Salibacterium salarium]RSL32657.1 hypothetical protein D7Z54_14495 [Salibacterium salarium]
MKLPKEINSVHFVYLFLLFTIILGFLGGLFFSNNVDVFNAISFSSALISIVIGLLAIFIATYQGLTQSTSVEKIQEASDRVDVITGKLENYDFEMMDTKLDDIKEKTHILDSLQMFSNQDLDNDNDNDNDNEKVQLKEESFRHLFINKKIDIYFLNLYKIAREKEGIDLRKVLKEFSGIESNKISYGFLKGLMVKNHLIISKVEGVQASLDKKGYLVVSELPDFLNEDDYYISNSKIKDHLQKIQERY